MDIIGFEMNWTNRDNYSLCFSLARLRFYIWCIYPFAESYDTWADQKDEWLCLNSSSQDVTDALTACHCVMPLIVRIDYDSDYGYSTTLTISRHNSFIRLQMFNNIVLVNISRQKTENNPFLYHLIRVPQLLSGPPPIRPPGPLWRSPRTLDLIRCIPL